MLKNKKLDDLIFSKLEIEKEIDKRQYNIPKKTLGEIYRLQWGDNVPEVSVTVTVPATINTYVDDGKISFDSPNFLIDAQVNEKKAREAVAKHPKVIELIKKDEDRKAAHKALIEETCKKYKVSKKKLQELVERK